MGWLHSGLNGADHGESAAIKAAYNQKIEAIRAKVEAEQAAYNQAHPEEARIEAEQEVARQAFWELIETDPAAALTQLKGIARRGMVPCVKNPYEDSNPHPVRCPASPTKLWEATQHGWTYYPYWED